MPEKKNQQQLNSESLDQNTGGNNALEAMIKRLVSEQVEAEIGDVKRQFQNLQDEYNKLHEEVKQKDGLIEKQNDQLEKMGKLLDEFQSKDADKDSSDDEPPAPPYVHLDDFKMWQTQVMTLNNELKRTTQKVDDLDRWRQTDIMHFNARILKAESSVTIFDKHIRAIPDLQAGEKSLRNLVNQLWARLLDQDEIFERLNLFEGALSRALTDVLLEANSITRSEHDLILPTNGNGGTFI